MRLFVRAHVDRWLFLLDGLLIAALLLLLLAACSAAHAGWCALHAARFVSDIHHHSHGWAALQAMLAAHHCSRI